MFAGIGSKGGVQTAALQKDWSGVIKSGLAALKANPWDTSTFLKMADACGNLQHSDTQAVYLRAALKFNPAVESHCSHPTPPAYPSGKKFLFLNFQSIMIKKACLAKRFR